MSRHADPLGQNRRWFLYFAASAWGMLIVGTSCTVVLPHDFFLWFGSHVFTSESAYAGFVTFWGISWFAIVKGWHAAEFAVVCLLALALLKRFSNRESGRNVLVAMALSTLFAMSDEYHQTFVPGRGGTWTDVGIDSLGILLVGLIALQRQERTRRLPAESLMLQPAGTTSHDD